MTPEINIATWHRLPRFRHCMTTFLPEKVVSLILKIWTIDCDHKTSRDDKIVECFSLIVRDCVAIHSLDMEKHLNADEGDGQEWNYNHEEDWGEAGRKCSNGTSHPCRVHLACAECAISEVSLLLLVGCAERYSRDVGEMSWGQEDGDRRVRPLDNFYEPYEEHHQTYQSNRSS